MPDPELPWVVVPTYNEVENLEGLVHASEATHDPRAKLPDLFKTGDAIDVSVLTGDPLH